MFSQFPIIKLCTSLKDEKRNKINSDISRNSTVVNYSTKTCFKYLYQNLFPITIEIHNK